MRAKGANLGKPRRGSRWCRHFDTEITGEPPESSPPPPDHPKPAGSSTGFARYAIGDSICQKGPDLTTIFDDSTSEYVYLSIWLFAIL